MDKQLTWGWLAKSDLKPTPEALIFAVRKLALSTNYVKFRHDKTVGSPLCRACRQKGETISQLVSEF